MKLKSQTIQKSNKDDLSSIAIPQWQIDKVLEAKQKAIANPSILISWEDVKKNIKTRDRNHN